MTPVMTRSLQFACLWWQVTTTFPVSDVQCFSNLTIPFNVLCDWVLVGLKCFWTVSLEESSLMLVAWMRSCSLRRVKVNGKEQCVLSFTHPCNVRAGICKWPTAMGAIMTFLFAAPHILGGYGCWSVQKWIPCSECDRFCYWCSAPLSIMALALVEWLGESCWCVAVGHQCAWMVPSLSSSTLTLVVLGVSPEDPVQVEVDALDLIGRRLVGTSSGSREWQARRISRRIRCKMAWRIPSNTWWMIVRGIPGSQYWMIGWSIAWRFIENISWRIQWTI